MCGSRVPAMVKRAVPRSSLQAVIRRHKSQLRLSKDIHIMASPPAAASVERNRVDVSVASGYSVEIYNEVYSCGLSLHEQVIVPVPQHFNISENCEERWTQLPEKIPIASVALHSKPECHPPCVQVSLQELILSECSEMQLIVTCGDGINIWEKRVDFRGNLTRRTSKEDHSRHHTGFYCFLLMVVLAVIIFGCIIRLH